MLIAPFPGLLLTAESTLRVCGNDKRQLRFYQIFSLNTSLSC